MNLIKRRASERRIQIKSHDIAMSVQQALESNRRRITETLRYCLAFIISPSAHRARGVALDSAEPSQRDKLSTSRLYRYLDAVIASRSGRMPFQLFLHRVSECQNAHAAMPTELFPDVGSRARHLQFSARACQWQIRAISARLK